MPIAAERQPRQALFLEATRSRGRAAAFEVELSHGRLLTGEKSQGKTEGLITVSSPVSGRVLKIQEKSERVVSAGTPLLVMGDPTSLEVVVDLLSSEAVKVQPGMPVILDNWGGDQPLRARVRLIRV
jgi:HlyD family secretion protein